jgi:hypothetical protein
MTSARWNHVTSSSLTEAVLLDMLGTGDRPAPDDAEADDDD